MGATPSQMAGMPGSTLLGGSRFLAPQLITSSANIIAPANAKRLFTFLVGAGGSGGAINSGGPNASGGGQGAFGGVVFDWPKIIDMLGLGALSIGLTIPGATSGVGPTAGSQAGNTGGNTILTLGGLTLQASGGSGGAVLNASGSAPSPGGHLYAHTNLNYIRTNEAGDIPFGKIVSLFTAFTGQPTQAGLLYGQNANANSGMNSSNGNLGTFHAASGGASGQAGGNNNLIVLPWWVKQAGITLGTAGALTGTAGGGAASFSGAGSAGTTSVNSTSANATGYGGGSGGDACNGGTASTGTGAPGCAVIMWEVAA